MLQIIDILFFKWSYLGNSLTTTFTACCTGAGSPPALGLQLDKEVPGSCSPVALEHLGFALPPWQQIPAVTGTNPGLASWALKPLCV